MYNRNKFGKPKNFDLVNERIPFNEFHVIDENGNQLGKMLKKDALVKARENNFDLLCVSKNNPTCKFIDYGKYKYNRSKKLKNSKKNLQQVKIKEVRITPMIGNHDLEFKAKKAIEFLQNEDRVKLSLKFRGRQLKRKEIGHETINKFLEIVKKYGVPEKPPAINNRFLDVVIFPIKKKT